MPEQSYEVAAPLRLQLQSGETVAIPRWSLDGFSYPGAADILPRNGILVIPFQGVDIRFSIELAPSAQPGFLRFVGLSGRERETLALFYRSLLSGRMASTDDIITSLDTPVDLVPMEETEVERSAAIRGRIPRLLRILWNFILYVVLAFLVFGVMGGQIAALLDRIDVDRGRVVAPLVDHPAPAEAFVREIRVQPGDDVRVGDVLAVLGDPDLDDAVAVARQAVREAERALGRAEAALATLRAAMDAEGGTALPITARLAITARYQAEFFSDGDTAQMQRLWLSLRDLDPDVAPRFSPDRVIAERLAALIRDRRHALGDLRETLAHREGRRDAARVIALTDGTVHAVPVHPAQHVEEGHLMVQIEAPRPRLMLGWVTSEVADRVHLGQRVGITFANGAEILAVEGRITAVRAGPDPGQPNAFGQLVTIRAEGMDVAALRAIFPVDAPVDLIIHRDRLNGYTALASRVGATVRAWVTARLAP
ncbi:MAG: HlyD family efflux transporter periplasmic adaptor subunit [Pseudomonadota bacterium]